MDMDLSSFPYSRSLGLRAEQVYGLFVQSLELPGDIAECGVYTGTTSKQFVRYLEAKRISKMVHMFDTFDGFPNVITPEERRLSVAPAPLLRPGKLSCPVEEVVRRMDSLTRYVLHPGLFSVTLPKFSKPLCFIHSDADLYRSTIDVIRLADRCLVPNGTIVFDDYGSAMFPGVGLAIRRHLSIRKYRVRPLPKTIQFVATKR
jgi:hypothetical protein